MEIRNEGWHGVRHTPGEIEAWWPKVQDWVERTKAAMAMVHPADGENWATLDIVKLRPLQGVVVPDMQQKLSMLTQWLEKLATYIDERSKL